MQLEFTNKEDAEAYCIQNGMVFLLIRCKTPKYSMGWTIPILFRLKICWGKYLLLSQFALNVFFGVSVQVYITHLTVFFLLWLLLTTITAKYRFCLILRMIPVVPARVTPLVSSPGPKVKVNYCHHLASVVCKLFTFQASSPKPLGRLEPNLAGIFLGWSSTKLLFFVPVRYSIWLPGPIICSDWLKFQRSSSLKLMNWLNPNCKWMIIGMSITQFLFFMPIGNPRWLPSQDID